MKVPQVNISTYNSKANGVVERGHFNIREGILKACGNNIFQWPDKVAPAFFADKVTVSQTTGWSPYYILHGVHPVLPLDLIEHTFLVTGFREGLSSIRPPSIMNSPTGEKRRRHQCSSQATGGLTFPIQGTIREKIS